MDTVSSPPIAPSISPAEFAARLARADAPLVLDLRRDERFCEAGRIAPRAQRCAPQDVQRFAQQQTPREVIVYCVHGLEVGAQAAAELRAGGWDARFLEGGVEALVDAGLPTLKKRPDLGVTGEKPSRWITRARPKIDRIACPWLVRRFIDPRAEFFYVPADQVFAEAKRLQAVAYDISRAPIEHSGERCSFDTLMAAFDLHSPALDTLARIVRGADTDRPDLAAQASGLLAVSLGMSALLADDLAMLEAMMPVYDALYAWCAVARAETHTWKPDAMKAAA